MIEQQPSNEELTRARKRVKAIKGFYTHALVFVLVNTGLFVINLLSGDGWWFYIPLLGWGVGLAIHAVAVFGQFGPFFQGWEERKTQELIDRERDHT